MSSSDRLDIAHWILERNLHWIGAAEVKTGVIVALDTAMLATLAAAYSAATTHAAWANFFSAVSAGSLACGVLSCAMVVLPRVDGPRSSFIFFGCIVKDAAPDYAEAFRKASTEQLLDDCLVQIHRNAEIACKKFGWVRKAMGWSFAAVLPWVCALVVLIGR